VVEAKDVYHSVGDGLQQAKEYAEMLKLKFAYSTNGHEIIEFDYLNGTESVITEFPTPAELWHRLQVSQAITEEVKERLLTPFNHITGKSPRYYQEIAINRVVQAILQGKKRVLITMATGTGKNIVLARVIGSMTEFKQIIGRGTRRLPDSYRSLSFYRVEIANEGIGPPDRKSQSPFAFNKPSVICYSIPSFAD
jgi:type I site-specific restriction endonuclease